MKATELMIGFKYIPQYEGLYSIDENGNVYSHISGKILKTHKNHRGYLMVDLYKNGKSKKGTSGKSTKSGRIVLLIGMNKE